MVRTAFAHRFEEASEAQALSALLKVEAAMIDKIISGGQCGVDRGALNFAIRNNIAHGGWCPKGRRSESGRIPDKYQLTETSSSKYPGRTAKNVQTADGTLILSRGKPSGGTLLTIKFCDSFDKPMLPIDINHPLDAEIFWNWLSTDNIQILNVAGPRESKQSGIQKQTESVLEQLFAGRFVLSA